MHATSCRRLADNRRFVSFSMMGFAAAAAVLPLVAAPTVAAAAVLPQGPSDVRTLSPVRGNYINNTLQGVECQAPNTCTPIKYPSFVTAAGVAKLDAVLKGELNPNTVVFAYSNGAQVATHWMTDHADDADAPSAGTVTFVLMGNSLRAHGGVDAELGISQPSQYQVIDIAREYDPVADYPDDHFNFLAVANALAGSQAIHDYRPVDINDPDNIVWTEGNITYVLVPTENLPLLNGLRRIGLNQLADDMQVTLKPKIDAAYDRSYIPAEALASSTATAVAETAAVTPNAEEPTADGAYKPKRTTLADSADVPSSHTGSHTSSRPDTTDVKGTVKTMTQRAAQQLEHLSTSLRSATKDSLSSASSARKNNPASTTPAARKRVSDSEG